MITSSASALALLAVLAGAPQAAPVQNRIGVDVSLQGHTLQARVQTAADDMQFAAVLVSDSSAQLPLGDGLPGLLYSFVVVGWGKLHHGELALDLHVAAPPPAGMQFYAQAVAFGDGGILISGPQPFTVED